MTKRTLISNISLFFDDALRRFPLKEFAATTFFFVYFGVKLSCKTEEVYLSIAAKDPFLQKCRIFYCREVSVFMYHFILRFSYTVIALICSAALTCTAHGLVHQPEIPIDSYNSHINEDVPAKKTSLRHQKTAVAYTDNDATEQEDGFEKSEDSETSKYLIHGRGAGDHVLSRYILTKITSADISTNAQYKYILHLGRHPPKLN